MNEISNNAILSLTAADTVEVEFTADGTQGQITTVGANATVNTTARIKITRIA